MRLMLDAVNVDRIPADWAGLVAGYLDGAVIPSTLPALRARFPHLQTVTIAVTAHQDAHVLDVERGDARPDQVPDWVRRQRSLGKDPTVYTSTAVWPQVKAACVVAGITPPHWWRAHYNGVAALEMGEVAHQFTNGLVPAGAPHRFPGCDTSVVADYWPGVDPAPAPRKAEDDVNPIYRVTDGPSVNAEVFDYGFGPVHISGPESAELTNAGVRVINISGDTFARRFKGVS